jgi:hypothetical protein
MSLQSAATAATTPTDTPPPAAAPLESVPAASVSSSAPTTTSKAPSERTVRHANQFTATILAVEPNRLPAIASYIDTSRNTEVVKCLLKTLNTSAAERLLREGRCSLKLTKHLRRYIVRATAATTSARPMPDASEPARSAPCAAPTPAAIVVDHPSATAASSPGDTAVPAGQAVPWPPPTELVDEREVEPFEWDEMRQRCDPVFVAYVDATATALALPPAVVVMMVLAVASLLALRLGGIQALPGHVEMPALWMLVFLPPGARKSPLLKQILDDAKAALLNGTPILTDVTSAGLRDALLQHGECVGLISAEGNLLEQTTSSAALRELLLKMYVGDPAYVARGGRDDDPTRALARPLGAMGIMAQPYTLKVVLRDAAMGNCGFFDRSLLLCQTEVEPLRYGERSQVASTLRTAFTRRLQDISALVSNAPHRVLQLSDEAIAAMQRIEREVHEDRQTDWNLLPGFAGKLIGHLMRVAGVLHLLGDSPESEIPAHLVEAAWILIRHCASHRLALIGLTPEQQNLLRLSRKVISWAVGRRLARFSASEAHQALREDAAWTRSEWDHIFHALVQAGFLRPVLLKVPGPHGGAPVKGFDVNPTLFN